MRFYIGLCFGPAGVGKTLSARRCANWDLAEPLIEDWGPRSPDDDRVHAALVRSRAVFYTASVLGTWRDLRDTVYEHMEKVGICIREHIGPAGLRRRDHGRSRLVDVLIVDESERLSNTAVELIRDIFDRTGVGLILIGMPGMEKRLSRYPQLYSRIGFAHHYRPLQSDELTFVLTRHWRRLGLALDEADFTDAQAVASIARITGGNFWLLERMLVQIGRILKINDLSTITDDVVEAARSTLVIGAT